MQLERTNTTFLYLKILILFFISMSIILLLKTEEV